MKTIKDLENVVANLSCGGEIHISTIHLTYDAEIRLRHYVQDKILIPDQAKLKSIYSDNEDLIERVMNGKIVLPSMRYIKAPTNQEVANSVEEAFTSILDHYETRNLELVAKNDELETQLLQYKIYVSDITTAIQKNICKDFCPNIGQFKRSEQYEKNKRCH